MGLSAARNIPADTNANVLPKLGEAFGHTFLWAFGIIGLAIVAALFLPRKRTEPQSDAERELSEVAGK
jgi:hypothetical protein